MSLLLLAWANTLPPHVAVALACLSSQVILGAWMRSQQ